MFFLVPVYHSWVLIPYGPASLSSGNPVSIGGYLLDKHASPYGITMHSGQNCSKMPSLLVSSLTLIGFAAMFYGNFGPKYSLSSIKIQYSIIFCPV